MKLTSKDLETVYVISYDEVGKIYSVLGAARYQAMNNLTERYIFSKTGLESLDTHWVNEGKIVLRETMPIKVEGHTLKRVPSGTVLMINSSSYLCESTEVALEFDQPGTYHLKATCWPYLDWEHTLEN